MHFTDGQLHLLLFLDIAFQLLRYLFHEIIVGVLFIQLLHLESLAHTISQLLFTDAHRGRGHEIPQLLPIVVLNKVINHEQRVLLLVDDVDEEKDEALVHLPLHLDFIEKLELVVQNEIAENLPSHLPGNLEILVADKNN